MSRHTLNSKCRLCRTQGTKLYLKGQRCFSGKCPIEKKGAVPPGMHGIKRRRPASDYSLQLKAKQKAKRLYGINETQFRNYYLQAKKLKGQLGDNMLFLLERRLDNVIYLSGLCLSRIHAKQLISHRHVLVNDKKLNVSSYLVQVKDKISLSQKTIKRVKDSLFIDDKEFKAPSWLDLDKKNYSVVVDSLPQKENIDQNIDINLIIEYYSR